MRDKCNLSRSGQPCAGGRCKPVSRPSATARSAARRAYSAAGGGRSASRRRWWSWVLQWRAVAISAGKRCAINATYRAADNRAQAAAASPFSGRWKAENRSLQRFVRTDAARVLPAVPLTALLNVAVPPTTNRLVSIPMVSLCIAMDVVMECIGMECIGVHCLPIIPVPRNRRPGDRIKSPGPFRYNASN